MTEAGAAVVPEELRVYMTVVADTVRGGFAWIAMGYVGGVRQGGFSSQPEARKAAESQKFQRGLVQVWAD